MSENHCPDRLAMEVFWISSVVMAVKDPKLLQLIFQEADEQDFRAKAVRGQ